MRKGEGGKAGKEGWKDQEGLKFYGKKFCEYRIATESV